MTDEAEKAMPRSAKIVYNLGEWSDPGNSPVVLYERRGEDGYFVDDEPVTREEFERAVARMESFAERMKQLATAFPCCDEMAGSLFKDGSGCLGHGFDPPGSKWNPDAKAWTYFAEHSAELHEVRFCPWCGAKLPESAP